MIRERKITRKNKNKKKEKYARMSLEKQNNVNQLDFIGMKRQIKEGIYLKYNKTNALNYSKEENI